MYLSVESRAWNNALIADPPYTASNGLTPRFIEITNTECFAFTLDSFTITRTDPSGEASLARPSPYQIRSSAPLSYSLVFSCELAMRPALPSLAPSGVDVRV